MQGYRIHFIRHAITEANEEGRYIGITESPVSQRGRLELDKKLKDFIYPDVDKVYVSPLKRCIATASFIYPEGYARIVPELREMNFGDFEGKKSVRADGQTGLRTVSQGRTRQPGSARREHAQRCAALL